MKLLVSKNEKVTTRIYVYEAEGVIESTHNAEDVPKDVKYETFTLVFRKPTYKDSKEISDYCSYYDAAGAIKIDILKLQSKILTQLLVEWDLKDESNETIPYNSENLFSLEPNVVRAMASSIMAVQKI